MNTFNHTSKSYMFGGIKFSKIESQYSGSLIPQKTQKVRLPESCEFYRESGFFCVEGSLQVFVIYGYAVEFPMQLDEITDNFLKTLTKSFQQHDSMVYETMKQLDGFGQGFKLMTNVIRKVSHDLPKVSGLTPLPYDSAFEYHHQWLAESSRDLDGVYRVLCTKSLVTIYQSRVYIKSDEWEEHPVVEDFKSEYQIETFDDRAALTVKSTYDSYQLIPELGGVLN